MRTTSSREVYRNPWIRVREDAVERVCGPGDFLATIYRHLGIDYAHAFIKDFNGRPTPIVDHGQAIPELTS